MPGCGVLLLPFIQPLSIQTYRKATSGNLAGQGRVFDNAIVNVVVEHARALLEV
jgi:hypothetical protein